MKRLIYALLVIAGFGMFLRDGFPMLMKAIEAGNIPFWMCSLLLLMPWVLMPLAALKVYRLLLWQVPTAQPEMMPLLGRRINVDFDDKVRKENAVLSEFVLRRT